MARQERESRKPTAKCFKVCYALGSSSPEKFDSFKTIESSGISSVATAKLEGTGTSGKGLQGCGEDNFQAGFRVAI